jgi:hypothetical protein
MKGKSNERRQPNAPIPPEQRAAPAYPVTPPPQRRKSKKPTAKSRLRAISDELGVTTPRSVKRSSAGVKQAPRARPRKVR